MNPKISIIVPAYNSQKTILPCLESILNQSFQDFEILVIDDFSKDDTKIITEQLRDKRIKIFSNSSNLGVSQSRNIGLQQSQGRYITTLDSDDVYFNPDKLSEEFKLITKKDCVSFSGYIRKDRKQLKHMLPYVPVEGEMFKSLLTRSIPIPRDIMFPKKALASIGVFDSTIPLFEDWDFKIRLSSLLPFYYSGIYDAVLYNNTDDSLSNTNQSELKYWQFHVFFKNIYTVPFNARSEYLRQFEYNISRTFFRRLKRRLKRKLT